MTNIKLISAVLTSLGGLTIGAGLLAQQTKLGAGNQPAAVSLPSAPKGSEAVAPPAIKALIEARIATAREIVQGQTQRAESSVAPPAEDTADWSRRWMDDELRLRTNPAARLTAIADHLERTKRLEQIADNLARAGQLRHSDALKARYHRLEAEQILLEARATHGTDPNPATAPKADRAKSEPPPATAPK